MTQVLVCKLTMTYWPPDSGPPLQERYCKKGIAVLAAKLEKHDLGVVRVTGNEARWIARSRPTDFATTFGHPAR